MKDLLTFLITKITGSEDFEVAEVDEGDDRTELVVNANSDIVGLIIGKEGKTIKNLRKIVAIKAVLLDKAVTISVEGKE